MSDRFTSQLRRHLEMSADTRPADGQLASLMDGVAARPQRHSLPAWLARDPGRVGPFLSTAVRYGLIMVALALALLAGASLAGGSRQPSTVFEGTWITVDPGDGSGMTLVVGPGQTPDVYFEDGFETGLACVNDEVKRFTARGTGTISTDGLVATFPDGGGCGMVTVGIRGTYEHDAGLDTLTDQDGLLWSRALEAPKESEAPAPTTAPEATEPLPTVVPASATPDATTSANPTVTVVTPGPDPDCIQYDAPGTYSAPVGDLSLTVEMPGSVDQPWIGSRAEFDVGQATCTGWFVYGWIDAGLSSLVDTTACTGERTAVASVAEAVAAIAVADGIDVVEQAEVSIDGYPGMRLAIEVPDVPNDCPEQQIPVLDAVNPVDRGVSIGLYLIDVDGTTLALGLFGYGGPDPAGVRDDVDAIIASMQIEP
jgi:hypothetical protein